MTGQELCLALYAQNVLAYDEAEVRALEAGDENTAYGFLIGKIRNIELTPAQLALDPCTASCVVTDVRNGEALALVTYPTITGSRTANILPG